MAIQLASAHLKMEVSIPDVDKGCIFTPLDFFFFWIQDYSIIWNKNFDFSVTVSLPRWSTNENRVVKIVYGIMDRMVHVLVVTN